MPVYTYRCNGCGKVTEENHPMSNIPNKVGCKHCGKEAKKVITSAPRVRYIGGDFVTNQGRDHDVSRHS